MEGVRIGVLVSGGGTNLQAIIDACQEGDIKGRIVLVISNKKDAYAIERAAEGGIRSEFVSPSIFKGEDYDRRLMELFEEEGVQLVVLAGYLRVLSPLFIDGFRNRIINIHPSLIPKFCGKGFYGERVHSAVLESGDRETGATVHIVDEGTDTGPILLQEVVPVRKDDTVETLKKRVLQVEHRILVKALGDMCLKLGNENNGGNHEASID
ncbi:phosphoribosylglycinamide formyltransferase [Gudongella sp. SC589]|uniref:phosphoribosylglycinamide formyltransferase n=1 Tax=Gudongella sp. SC589 TaxID=3385990 RepID=UPI0039047030